jgi:hypothetical protein
MVLMASPSRRLGVGAIFGLGFRGQSSRRRRQGMAVATEEAGTSGRPLAKEEARDVCGSGGESRGRAPASSGGGGGEMDK